MKIAIAAVLTAAALALAACSATPKPTPTVSVTTTATVTATATSTVTEQPTKIVATHNVTATVTFTPAPAVAFSDGVFQIPTDVKPGTYKTAGQSGGCYYARLSGLDTVDDIISNDNSDGPMIVTISASDKAFDASGGCDWTKVG